MIKRRSSEKGSSEPLASTKYEEALRAYEAELANSNHTTITLMGAVGSTMPPPLAITQDAVDGIEFLVRYGADRAVVVYAIVREFEAFRPAPNEPEVYPWRG